MDMCITGRLLFGYPSLPYSLSNVLSGEYRSLEITIVIIRAHVQLSRFSSPSKFIVVSSNSSLSAPKD